MNFWKRAPKSDRLLFSSSVACLALSTLLLSTNNRAISASAADDEQFLRFVDTAAEVYNEIQGKYVDEIEGKKVLEAALGGMFSALDEHSQYMDPQTLDNLNKDTGGNFSGIGIHITQRQGLLTVIAPIPGSPSAKLGIMPWDRIIEINGETTEGMDLQDAVSKLIGPAGTSVKVKIFREGEPEPLEFEITRKSIKIDSVYHKMLDEEIGYLRIARFSENTAADMRKGLLDLQAQNAKALVLDLRFNTGGLLREAIEVSNLFVNKNDLIVSTKGRLRSQNREYRATQEPIVKVPVFVLVNEGSASASEIVAGALQDHHLAVIVGPEGKNTFGKGSVQTIEPLRHSMYEDADGNPRESAIRLTTARYYTPSGRTIHHIGITPDVGVPLPENHERELLRHGLHGDTTIPITAEEQKLLEEDQKKEKDAGTEGVVLQKLEQQKDSTTTTPTATPGAQDGTTTPGQPFYSSAKKPEIVSGDFKDVLLREAQKQLRIFIILDNARKPAPNVASAAAGAKVSAAGSQPGAVKDTVETK